MKNFDEKEKQVQEICEKIRTASDLDIASRLAYYDIIKIVREAYYEGHDAGVAKVAEIQAKNQEYITNLFKKSYK